MLSFYKQYLGINKEILFIKDFKIKVTISDIETSEVQSDSTDEDESEYSEVTITNGVKALMTRGDMDFYTKNHIKNISVTFSCDIYKKTGVENHGFILNSVDNSNKM